MFPKTTLTLLLLAAVPGAAGLDYALRDWHVLDGLPNEETTRVLHARDGFLWIASAHGLVRFDGAQFENHPLRGPDGSVPTIARALAESEALGLVVAPAAGGLLAYRDREFRPVALPAAAAGRTFNVLFTAPDGALWSAGDDGVVMRLRGDTVESFSTTDGLNSRPVIFFAHDSTGQTWVVNGTNLHRYENGRLLPVALDRERMELRAGTSRHDGPWVVAHDRLLKFESGKFVEKITLPALAGAHYIQALLEDRTGALWIGTRSQGVFVFDGGALTHVATSHDDIRGLSEDTEGDLWVATNGGGLNRLRQKIFQVFDKNAGLRDNFSDTICEDVSGAMWFGNRDGGLARLRPGQSLEAVPSPAAWPIISVVSVAPHPAGGVWATAGAGMFRVEDKLPLAMQQLAVPAMPIVRCTYVAKDGALWFSAEPDRLGRLADGELTFFGPDTGFDGKQIRFIAEDSTGAIWSGTADGQLFRQASGRFERVPVGLPTGAINAIFPESDGTVWLGTAERGLVVRRGGRWESLEVAAGLPDNNVTQILADDRGNFWCGSPRGIFRVRRVDLVDRLEGRTALVHAVLIGKDEGLKDISCLGFFQPAAWKSRDGQLWFTTRRGVLQLDPALAIPEAAPPPVRIEEVVSDDRPVPGTVPLALGAAFRKLEFRFSVLCLATPERVRVKYRLDGFDTDWVVAAPSHMAAYPRLPAGDYRFRVTASLGDGRGEESGDTLAFSIVPPWWQTWWLRALGAGLVVLAVGLAARGWSHRRLRTKLDRLEREGAIERERTRIARNIHDDLGASLTRISLLTQSTPAGTEAAAAAHINHIYHATGEIIRSMDEIVWAVDPRHDNLESLAGYLGNFAQNFLRVAGIRCRLVIPEHLPDVDLTSQMRHHLFLCLKEALNNVVKHARADAVTLTVNLTGQVLTVQVADNGTGPTAALRDRDRISAGRGLDNLRQRMAELGGRCLFTHQAGQGTVVTFEVELPRSAPATPPP